MTGRAEGRTAALSLAGIVAAVFVGMHVGRALRREEAGLPVGSVPSVRRPAPQAGPPLDGRGHRLELRIVDLREGRALSGRQAEQLRGQREGSTGAYIALASEVGTLSRDHETESHEDWRARLDRRTTFLRALLHTLVVDGGGDLIFYCGPHRLQGWLDRYVRADRRGAEAERALKKVVMHHNAVSQWNDQSGAALGYGTPTAFGTIVRDSTSRPGRWSKDSVIRIDPHEDMEPIEIEGRLYSRWVYRNAEGRYQELKALADVAAEHGIGLLLYGKSIGPQHERSPYRDDFNQVVRMEAYLEHARFPVIVGHARNADPGDADSTIYMLGQDRTYAIIDLRDASAVGTR